MNRLLSLLWMIIVCSFHLKAQTNNNAEQKSTKIIIELKINSDAIDVAALEYSPVEVIGISRDWQIVSEKVKQGIAKWNFFSAEPIYIYPRRFFSKQNAYWMTEPGDSIQ